MPDIRLAKGEDLDKLREEFEEHAASDHVTSARLEQDGYLKKCVVSALPTMPKFYDFEDGVSVFINSNRVGCTVETDDSGNSYQNIRTANNAANTYAYATLDISAYTANVRKITVEFDSYMGKDRWFIGLCDSSQRPGSSYRATYSHDGVIFSQGTKDGSYYFVNGTNTWKTEYFLRWIHTKLFIDLDAKTVDYEISSDNPSDTLSASVSFADTSVEQLTGIEIYSYVNNAEMRLDNISIVPKNTVEIDERTIYIVPDNGVLSEYMYIDGAPVLMNRSDLFSTLTNLIERVEALENDGG